LYPRITRRKFLAGTSIALLSAHSFVKGNPHDSVASKLLVTGIQLQWLSPELEKDFDGTLGQIAAMGYKDVELADNFGRTPRELVASFNAARLRCESRHFWIEPGSNSIQAELAQQIEFAHAMGLRYLVAVAPIPVKLRDNLDAKAFTEALDRVTLDDYRRLAGLLNTLGVQTRAAGIQLAYHNFNTEFRRFDGVAAYDRLLQWTDPDLVKMEMDCGWLVAGGADPTRYLRDYPGRFRLLHIKDVRESDPNTVLRLKPVEVGGGIVSWAPLLTAARSAHVRVAYVEFEPEPPLARPLLESARMCLDYLQRVERS
jgi:sugar phosphate isomerase/epimerase